MLNYLPFLEYLPGDLFRAKRVLSNKGVLYGLLGDRVEAHKRQREEATKDVDRAELKSDFIHGYLNQIQRHDDSGKQHSLDRKLVNCP